ncbi:MAG: hypothetical protein IT343_08165 [Candidatus Melainabacteria bacterium]|nr:hypothetical protein [Candidatus Melainabacteria bacterium]
MKKISRRKALLAILFASGLLHSQQPAISKAQSKNSKTLVELVEENKKLAKEEKAFYLLLIANEYLSGREISFVYDQFRNDVKNRSASPSSKVLAETIFNFAQRVASGDNLAPTTQKIPVENLKIANLTIQSALTKIELPIKSSTDLQLLFIASRLFKSVENADELSRCHEMLDDALRSCENNRRSDKDMIEAASSVLCLMAYGFIAIRIEDDVSPKIEPIKIDNYTSDNFIKAEKLLQRAAAISDKLPADNHNRRKMHRDLALWYARLGKAELAAKEKEILFNLVGLKDDSILYPRPVGCGHLVWWERWNMAEDPPYVACGMG